MRVPSLESAKALVHEFLSTGRRPDWAREAEATSHEIDLDLVRTLFRHAMEQYDARRIDAFVAPRLHCALRLPRRVAYDRGVWTWLAVECDDFIRFRFDPPVGAAESDDEDVSDAGIHHWRYDGEILRNGVARLWWGAELVRNGPSYAYVPHVFRSVKTAEYALELVYSWHRPAAIAFTRVAAGIDGAPSLPERHMKELSKRLRVQLALRAAEAVGADGDEIETDEFDIDWARHRPAWADLRTTDVAMLEGPTTGVGSPEAIDELTTWFRRIADRIAVPAVQSASGRT
ncbi:MAG: DUF6339 family protein [Gemmatimonadaceae bacterium]